MAMQHQSINELVLSAQTSCTTTKPPVVETTWWSVHCQYRKCTQLNDTYRVVDNHLGYKYTNMYTYIFIHVVIVIRQRIHEGLKKEVVKRRPISFHSLFLWRNRREFLCVILLTCSKRNSIRGPRASTDILTTGTLCKNVSLVQKSQNFFVECPCSTVALNRDTSQEIGKSKFVRFAGWQDSILLLKTTHKNRNPKLCDPQKSGKSGFPIFASSQKLQ
jgi:hypothetical protein